jgi:flagellar protein FliT
MSTLNADSVIILYESVADLTGQMLEAARNNDWDQLIEIESHCSTYAGKFKDCDAQLLAMTGEQRAHQMNLIETILHNNQSIRDLIEPNMTLLSGMIKNTGNERKLAKMYNITSGD